jgi:deazaflavin-dependent oxidoreductase (nitroreductase family)
MHEKKDGIGKRLLGWFGSTRPGAWTMINLASVVDKRLIRASGGRFNMTFAWPCLLLKTTGAKTGKERTIPLLYLRDGGNFVLIASKGGNVRHPAWYVNLKANPEVEIFVDGETVKCTASDAEGEERKRLWGKAAGVYDGYEKYRKRAGEREIPVVILTRKHV